MANEKKQTPKVDSIPWVVKDTSGKQVLKDSWNTFTEAASAARTYTRETGLYAQAVRS